VTLEDERLAGLSVADVRWMIEEHARHFPGLREAGGMTLYLDEVQTVPGWEGLARRLMDTGGFELFVTVQSWPEIRLAREGGKPEAEQAALFE